MFAALSQCQALHPDPEEDSEEEEQQGDLLCVVIIVRDPTTSFLT